MGSRRYINLERKPSLPFSDAVLVNDSFYISGRTGNDPETGMAPAEIERELELLFNDFAAVLAQVEMTMDDLVWVQVFSPDISLWERFRFEMMGTSIRRREYPRGYFSLATTKSGAHNSARLISLSGKLQIAFRASAAYCIARAVAASSEPYRSRISMICP
jgi:enamine deaminase RidA (YjgF/YER057c/UK114 family)